MEDQKKVRHLSIYLAKKGLVNDSDVLETTECGKPFDVPIAGYESGRLYVKRDNPHSPSWADLFHEFIDPKSLIVRSVAAALILKVDTRIYILTFGQAGRFLIKEDVFEERFGLLCALNTVDPKTLRCVDVQSLDAIDSHTRIQSGQETTHDQFGLSIEQDMLKAIVGAPANPALGSRMSGHDSLAVSVSMNISDLPTLLIEYGKSFEKELDAKNYEWVNNISMTKSPSVIASLESALDAKLGKGNYSNVWLSIPEIIDWTLVRGFTFSGGKRVIYTDISLPNFLKTVSGSVTLELLHQRKVFCSDSEHKHVFKSWTVYKCLYAEVELDGDTYILNDGKWFSIANDFASKIKKEYEKIPRSKLKLPLYVGGGEGEYNKSVAEKSPDVYDLLDAKLVLHGGGRGSVEICDLLSLQGELIHVKQYGKSSLLSHLFAQGFVSGQLIQSDSEFRKGIQSKLSATHKGLIDPGKEPTPYSLTITYAVISEESGEALTLPFFSLVNLVNTRRALLGYRYNVELLKIGIDPSHSKKVIAPSKKPKKSP